MRVMIIRRADEHTETGALPGREVLEAMGRYMEAMGKAGVLLAGEGLKPSSQGKRIRVRKGKQTVIDGPFAETKELIAGYALIEVRSMEEAVEWVKKWPREDGDVELEIRPLFENDDFGEEFTPEAREREHRLREEASKRSADHR